MNIFLPYENSIEKSVQSLDDVRLNKQAVECYQLLTSALKERNGEVAKNHHPIYLFYKDNPEFIAHYGFLCCLEWEFRFSKQHSLFEKFKSIIMFNDLKHPTNYTPYYMEGAKNSANCIRTTQNVSSLFQNKLCEKWDRDKEKGRTPRWTNREVPNFYKERVTNAQKIE